jgi:hypothetical protein
MAAGPSLAVAKSNWAQSIDEPPFEAYQVGCGITFTFGRARHRADDGAGHFPARTDRYRSEPATVHLSNRR